MSKTIGTIASYMFLSFLLFLFVYPAFYNTKNNFKTEYEIELINQDSANIYSVSNDTIYKVLIKDIEKTIELDNL